MRSLGKNITWTALRVELNDQMTRNCPEQNYKPEYPIEKVPQIANAMHQYLS